MENSKSSVSLNLSKNVLSLELSKKGVGEIKPCQVSFQLDVSGSFHNEHRNGYTNDLLTRILPFALLFDKDGVLDMFSFGNESLSLTQVTERNFIGYVKNNVMNQKNYNGWATNYKPAFKDLFDNGVKEEVVEVASNGFWGKVFGGTKQTKEMKSIGKHLSFFVTDGFPSDPLESIDFFKSYIDPEHFIVFISISGISIDHLNFNYRNKKNSNYINITHEELSLLSEKSDEDLYEMFLTPTLIDWMNK